MCVCVLAGYFILVLTKNKSRFRKLVDFGLVTGSTAGMPINVNKSESIADFKRVSNGESQPNDGDKFTSNNHGFKSESTRTSNPYNSE